MVAEQSVTPQAARARETQFFTRMAWLVAAVIAAGFGPSCAASLAPPGLPFWVHLHGAVMLGWISLFVSQTTLIKRHSVALHKRLGLASIGLVGVMVPLGIATNLLAIRRGATPPFFTPAMMFSADLCDILIFAGLFTAALALRKNGAWHKRLMLCATVLLTWPALGRLVGRSGVGLDLVIPVSVTLLLALSLIGPWQDWRARGQVHAAYRWGVGLIFAAQPAHLYWQACQSPRPWCVP